MRSLDNKRLVSARPFQPLRIHVTRGRYYDVGHPDQIIVERSDVPSYSAAPSSPGARRGEAARK